MATEDFNSCQLHHTLTRRTCRADLLHGNALKGDAGRCEEQ